MSASITLTDPAQLAALAAAGVMEVRDPSGAVIGTLIRRNYGDIPGVKSPISDEEFERARHEPGEELSLAEVWARIRARHQP